MSYDSASHRGGIGGLAVRRPVGVGVLFLAITALGVAAALRLPTSLLPRLELPAVTLEVDAGELSPAEVEELVTRPVEEALAAVPSVVEVRSLSESGRATVDARLAWGAAREIVILDLLAAAKNALPRSAARGSAAGPGGPGIGSPRLLRTRAERLPVLTLTLTGLGPSPLRDAAEVHIRPALERLDGVARVELRGGTRAGIDIEVDRSLCLARGVAVSSIARAVDDARRPWASTLVRDREGERTIEIAPPSLDPATVAALGVIGAGARVGDLARVSAADLPIDGVVLRDGRDAVVIEVFADAASGAVAASDAVLPELARLNTALPVGARLLLVEDRAAFVRSAIDGVGRAAALGALLAVAVLAVAIRRVMATVAVAVAVPVSLATTFLLLDFAGLTLNLMTLGGLALGVGLVLDSSIVVLEAIDRRVAAGDRPGLAAVVGTGEVTRAIVASTATTLVVFLPVVYLTGTAAALFREQAIAVGLALVASLSVSLALTPMLAARTGGAARILGGDGSEPGRYGRLVGVAVARPWSTLALCALATGCCLPLASRIATDLLPATPGERLIADLRLPPGTTVSGARRELGRLTDAVARLPAVAGQLLEINTADDGRVERALLSVLPATDAEGASAVSRRQLRQAIDDLAHRIPGCSVRLRATSNPIALALGAADTPFRVDILGDDVDDLRTSEAAVAAALRRVEGLTAVEEATRAAVPQVEVLPRESLLRASGLGVADLAAAVGDALLERTYPPTPSSPSLRLRGTDDAIAAELGDLRLNLAPVGFLYLKDFAEIRAVAGPRALSRVRQRRAGVVTAEVDGVPLSVALSRAERALARLPLPEGVELELSGSALELRRSFRDLGFALLLAVALTYVVLVVTFESYLSPLLVMTTVPLAASGVILPFALTGVPFTVMSFVGVIVLVGISVNNGILLVDAIAREVRAGRSAVESAVVGARRRLRPVFLTTATSVLAMAPLVLAPPAAGGDMARSLAMTIAGGLLASALLVTLVLPALAHLVFAGRR